MSKNNSSRPAPVGNLPSKTGNKSGGGRGNAVPAPAPKGSKK